MREIICQNCEKPLAQFLEKDVLKINPVTSKSLVQELDKDTTLLTLQCPTCDCILQVKI